MAWFAGAAPTGADGRLLVGGFRPGSSRSGQQGTLWRLPGLQQDGALSNPFNGDSTLLPPRRACTTDGVTLVATCTDHTVGGWDLATGAFLGRPVGMHGEPGPAIMLQSLPGHAVAGIVPGHIHLFDFEMVLWRPQQALVGPRPVSDVTPSELAGLRSTIDPDRTADRAWLALLEALVTWHHRHDVEIPATDPQGARIDPGPE